MDSTVPSGYTPESENSVVKELKSIQGTLLTLVNNLDSTNKKTIGRFKSIEDILKTYPKYAERNAENNKSTEDKLKAFIELQKKQTAIQSEMLNISAKQAKNLQSLYNEYSKQSKEKQEDIRKRRVASGEQQPEEREINKARYNSGLNTIPEGLSQAFMNTKDTSTVGSLFSGLGGLTKAIHTSKGGRSLDQYKEALEEQKQEEENSVRKSLGIYNYDITSASGANEFLNRSDINNYKKLSKTNAGERGIPSISTENKEYSLSGIAPSKVKEVLGSHGVGYLYLGEILKDNLGDKKETDENKKKKENEDLNIDGIGTTIAMLLKSSAVVAGIGAALPLILTGAVVAGVLAAFIKANNEDKKKSIDLLQKNFGLSKEEAIEKLEADNLNATYEGTINNSGVYEVNWEKKWENIQKAADGGDDNAKKVWDLIRSKTYKSTRNFTGYYANPLQELSDVYRSDKNMASIIDKYHNGGIIGQKEILAQKGEVILPVDDSQYGLDSGILKKTENGGVSINRDTQNNMSTQNMERLLQELLSVVSTNLIGAIKENKPEQSKQMVVPQINLNTLSYRG